MQPLRPKDSDSVGFDAVLAAERAVVPAAGLAVKGVEPKEAAATEVPVAVGLALSGGGIRSATFSLGVLQALAGQSLLRRFDYLSTVSGGGYIGSWLSAWIHRHPQGLAGVQSLLARGASAPVGTPATTEAHEVSWLRKFSNYLAPRLGLLSLDSLTLVTTWVRNVTLNQIVILSLLAFLFILPRAMLDPLHWLLPFWIGAGWVTVGSGLIFLIAISAGLTEQAGTLRPWAQRLAARLDTARVSWGGLAIVAGAFSALAASVWLFGPYEMNVPRTHFYWSIALLALPIVNGAAWFALHEPRASAARPGPIGGIVVFALAYYAALGVGVLLYLGIDAFIETHFALGRRDDEHTAFLAYALTIGPALFVAGFGICGSVFVGIVGRLYYERSREWWSRLNAAFIIAGVVWVTVFAFAFYVPALGDWAQDSLSGWMHAILASAWVGSALAALLTPDAKGSSDRIRRLVDRGLNALALVFAIGLALVFATIVHRALLGAAGAVSVPVNRIDVVSSFQALVLHDGATTAAETHVAEQRIAPLHRYVAAVMDENEELRRRSALRSGSLLCEWSGFEWLAAACSPGTFLWMALAAVALIFALFAWRVDVNKFSLHNMYRNRLTRCYLGASNRERRPLPFIGFDEHDDVPLRDLRSGGHPQRPVHIINTTMNLSQGEDLAWQERKGASFVFTANYCGFSFARTQGDSYAPRQSEPSPAAAVPIRGTRTAADPENYRPTDLYAAKDGSGEEPGFTLGMAMTTSGAAVSPNMGRNTQPALAFLLTVFNVRLGRWSPNPAQDAWQEASPELGIKYLLAELFGFANERRNFLYLSDGGHFENTAIYELVRRRCKLIVAVDAGADPERQFGDLGEAVRKCRIDFGVEIRLSLEALQGDSDGRANAGFAIGDILYSGDEDGLPGKLIVIKPTLTRSREEPADILAYAVRNPGFPQQSTSDQFFDESQFESYRRLGLHIAGRALAATGNLDTVLRS